MNKFLQFLKGNRISLLMAFAIGVAFLCIGQDAALAAPFLSAGMIMDARNEFCDATALNTGGAASYLIGNVMDLGAAARDIGNGEPLYLVITVDTSVDSAADNTVQQFHLCSDAQAAIAVDGSATYHFSTSAIPQANLAAGTRVACVALPQGNYERYLGIVQTTSVAAATAGKVNAFLTKDPTGWKAYPDAL